MALLDSQDENAERVGRTIAERNYDHKGRNAREHLRHAPGPLAS